MPKARRRKGTPFETSLSKSVFLYGEPTKKKTAGLEKMQAGFLALVNQDIQMLHTQPGITRQLVKNDKKDSLMRSLEKQMREKGVNSAFCQNAFDMAVTRLSSRFDAIRLEIHAQEQTIFTQSKVLFAMSIDGASREAMAEEMESISKKPDDFYADCAKKLWSMEEGEFQDAMLQFQDSYAMCSLEFRVPELKSVEVPLDSRLMKITPSDHIGAPYVISICDPYQKGSKWTVIPLNTSRHSLHKITSNKMAGTVMASIRDGKLRIAWSYTRTPEQPKTSEASGVDTGITDAFYVSDGNHYGSMKPVLDFYYSEVEPAFAELSNLRNKKSKIKHYLHTHPDLDDDVRRSLIAKMDRLEHMIQTMRAPYRKLRHYNNLLEQAVSEAVNGYIDNLSPETLTVLERLDIKEFNRSRKANGEMSTFARGLLQKKLMAELNWKGRDFLEVEPAYTSQVCPVCGNLDKANRNGKTFHCTCCGHEDDADHNASVNIRARVMDQEILELCEKYKYARMQLKEHLRELYAERNAEYKKQNPAESAAPQGAA